MGMGMGAQRISEANQNPRWPALSQIGSSTQTGTSFSPDCWTSGDEQHDVPPSGRRRRRGGGEGEGRVGRRGLVGGWPPGWAGQSRGVGPRPRGLEARYGGGAFCWLGA